MTLLVASVDGVAPATGEFTFDHPSVTEKKGPYWVSLQAWVHTEDTDNFSGFSLEIEYVDPVGETRFVGGSTNIALNDKASGISSAGPFVVERENDTATFKLKTSLSGIAGTALVSYRVMMTPADTCDLQSLYLVPIP